MYRRPEPSPAAAVDDPRFTRARKQRVAQEGVERLDRFRCGLAVQIQSTCNVLGATCYGLLTCNVLSATCYRRAASWLCWLQVGGGDDDGTSLQLDQVSPAVAHFAHDPCAESRDMHAIARSESRHLLRSIALRSTRAEPEAPF
jgi:hypothetical protein